MNHLTLRGEVGETFQNTSRETSKLRPWAQRPSLIKFDIKLFDLIMLYTFQKDFRLESGTGEGGYFPHWREACLVLGFLKGPAWARSQAAEGYLTICRHCMLRSKVQA